MLLVAGPHQPPIASFPAGALQRLLRTTNSSPDLPTPGRAGVSAPAMTRRFSDQPESTTPSTTLGGSMKASSRPQGPRKSATERPRTKIYAIETARLLARDERGANQKRREFQIVKTGTMQE